MTTSRKDYEAIAEAISSTLRDLAPAGPLAVGAGATVAAAVADALASTGPRFDRDRFLAAAFAGAPVDRCAVCVGVFTQDDWEDRHTGHDGEDLHAACCEAVGPCSQEPVR